MNSGEPRPLDSRRARSVRFGRAATTSTRRASQIARNDIVDVDASPPAPADAIGRLPRGRRDRGFVVPRVDQVEGQRHVDQRECDADGPDRARPPVGERRPFHQRFARRPRGGRHDHRPAHDRQGAHSACRIDIMPRLKGASMALVRRMVIAASLVLGALVLFAGGWLVGRLGIGSVVDPASLTDAERQFTERMRDVTPGRLVHGRRPGRPHAAAPTATTSPASRRSATICGGSTPRWIAAASTARYPIVVPMRWIGDTPVIMMTDTQPARAGHVHRAPVLLRRSLRRHLAARRGRRPHVGTNRETQANRVVDH